MHTRTISELASRGVRRRLSPPGRLTAAAVLGLFLAGCATPEPTVMRGFLDHKKVDQVGQRADCELTVLPADTDGRIGIRAVGVEDVSLRETLFYEKLLEYKNAGEQDPSKIRRVTVQGEFLEVPGEVKNVRRTTGLLANVPCVLNGVPLTLDAQGEYRDRTEIILGAFDRKGLGEKADVTLPVEFPARGQKKELTLSRRELFDTLGLPWESAGATSGDGLVCSVTWTPEKPRRGDRVQITFTVENRGDRPAAKVVGRLFSRQAWLDSRNFYIGVVPAKAKRSFSRQFTVPATLVEPGGTVFAALAAWNVNAGEKLGKSGAPMTELQLAIAP